MSERPTIDVMSIPSHVAFRKSFVYKGGLLSGTWQMPAPKIFLATEAQEEVYARLALEADMIYLIYFNRHPVMAFDPGSGRWFERDMTDADINPKWRKIRPHVIAHIHPPTALKYREFMVVVSWGLKELVRQRVIGIGPTIYPDR